MHSDAQSQAVLCLIESHHWLWAQVMRTLAPTLRAGANAADQELVALCEAPHNKRMQQTIPPANKFASGLAPDPPR
jgi:hypothetical protein